MPNWIETFVSTFHNNPPLEWLALVVVCLFLTLAVKFVLGYVTRELRRITERTESVWDDIGVDLIDGLKRVTIFTWFLYLFAKPLEPSGSVEKLLLIAVVVCTVFQLMLWGLYLIKNWKINFLDTRISSDPSSAAALGLLYTTIQTLFIVIIFLIGLSNLGVNIGALLAGLGVGGIAIALAAQNVLGDLLASLSIVLDKPFIIGDFIIAGKEMGTVEQIGIKTTRLRALSGEQLVISNKDLLGSRIQNFKKMYTRRIVQNFNVDYSTTPEKLAQIPIWVKEFVTQHKQIQFDRCHLANLNESSLFFEFVFIVQDPDYNLYMDLQQEILLNIIRKLNAEGIKFAFPARSLFVREFPEEPKPKPAPNAAPSVS